MSPCSILVCRVACFAFGSTAVGFHAKECGQTYEDCPGVRVVKHGMRSNLRLVRRRHDWRVVCWHTSSVEQILFVFVNRRGLECNGTTAEGGEACVAMLTLRTPHPPPHPLNKDRIILLACCQSRRIIALHTPRLQTSTPHEPIAARVATRRYTTLAVANENRRVDRPSINHPFARTCGWVNLTLTPPPATPPVLPTRPNCCILIYMNKACLRKPETRDCRSAHGGGAGSDED